MNSASIEQQVLSVLDRSGQPFEVIPCDPSFADTEAFCSEYGYPLDRSGNTILVASKRPPGRLAACVVLASTRLDVNKRVRDYLGVRKLSFASPDTTVEATGMAIGGVTPLALPSSLLLLIDDRLMALDWVILGSGTRTSKIKTHPNVLAELPGAEVIKDLAIPAAG